MLVGLRGRLLRSLVRWLSVRWLARDWRLILWQEIFSLGFLASWRGNLVEVGHVRSSSSWQLAGSAISHLFVVNPIVGPSVDLRVLVEALALDSGQIWLSKLGRVHSWTWARHVSTNMRWCLTVASLVVWQLSYLTLWWVLWLRDCHLGHPCCDLLRHGIDTCWLLTII